MSLLDRQASLTQPTQRSDMKALRIIGIVFGLILMAGFGMCGLLGVVLGVGEGSQNMGILALGLAGFAVCAFAGWCVYKLFRQLNAKPPAG